MQADLQFSGQTVLLTPSAVLLQPVIPNHGCLYNSSGNKLCSIQCYSFHSCQTLPTNPPQSVSVSSIRPPLSVVFPTLSFILVFSTLPGTIVLSTVFPTQLTPSLAFIFLSSVRILSLCPLFYP